METMPFHKSYLEVLIEASIAAGLQGHIRIRDKDIEVFDSNNLDSALKRISDGLIDCLHDAGEGLKSSAVFFLHISTNRPARFNEEAFFDKNGELPRENSKDYEKFKKAKDAAKEKNNLLRTELGKISNHLSKIGISANLSDSCIYAPVILKRAITHEAYGPTNEHMDSEVAVREQCAPLASLLDFGESFDISFGTVAGVEEFHDLNLADLTAAEYVKKNALCMEKLAELDKRWQMAGKNIELFARCSPLEERTAVTQRLPMLVPGHIPCGVVTLLVGPKKIGKSTLMGSLAVAVVSNKPFLGQTVNPEVSNGLVVIFSGEDHESMVRERLSYHGEIENEWRIIIKDDINSEEEFNSYLDDIKEADISLILVDPLRKFMFGNEDDSAICSKFFTTLEKFAREKGCAVLVVHHSRKGQWNTLQSVVEAARGSGVISDRPRVLMGIYESGTRRKIGIFKHNFPHTYGMIEGARTFEFDKNTLQVMLVEDGISVGIDTELDKKVIEAVQRLNEENVKVTRTNKYGLYELQPVELRGYTRAHVRAAVARCLGAGTLALNQDGNLIA